MGGGPVCPPTTQICGYFTDQGQIMPNWDADASTYRIRQEFEPVVDLTNSSIIGHEDEQPLHPGIMYTAQVVLSDRNGWDDIQFVQFALGEDVNDDETSIFIQLEEDENVCRKPNLNQVASTSPSPISIRTCRPLVMTKTNSSSVHDSN